MLKNGKKHTANNDAVEILDYLFFESRIAIVKYEYDIFSEIQKFRKNLIYKQSFDLSIYIW